MRLILLLLLLILQLPIGCPLSSLVTKKRTKKSTSQKAKKAKNFGRVPQHIISSSAITGREGLKDGGYAEHVFRSARDLSGYVYDTRRSDRLRLAQKCATEVVQQLPWNKWQDNFFRDGHLAMMQAPPASYRPAYGTVPAPSMRSE